MSQLPKEYQAIVDEIRAAALQKAKLNNLQILDQGAVRDAVERCFALANKPVRELTAEEIYRAFDPADEHSSPEFHNQDWLARIRNILMAHQRKQQEPETVTFRAARHKVTGFVDMFKANVNHATQSDWEWLEPAQTIEVKV